MTFSWGTLWLGNTVRAWTFAAIALAIVFLAAYVFKRSVQAHFVALAARENSPLKAVIAEVLSATRGWLVFLLAACLVGMALNWPAGVHGYLVHGADLAFGVQAALWLTRLVAASMARAQARGATNASAAFTGVLTWAISAAIWVLLVLAVLANAGVNVTAFVASLGVGGIAIALAAQNILGDLFASVSIGLDRPFDVGDYIAFGSESGTVLRVGIKSTRIRSISGEEMAIANSQLLQQLIRNYGRMQERRVAFGFGLGLGTSAAEVQAVIERVKALIAAVPRVRLDRGHMTAFGESSLDLEFVYYVLDPGFEVYRDVQQQINFAIMELLATMGVKLAVPARVVHSAS